MHYRHDISQALPASIGEDGVDEQALAAHGPRLRQGIAKLEQWRNGRELPMLNLPDDTADIAEIEEVGAWFRSRFAHVLVVGTGGSSLGGQTLVALKENIYKPGVKGAPRLWFFDNVDPATMDTLLASIDLAETGCLVISKSGGTAEIIAQTLVLLSSMREKLGRLEGLKVAIIGDIMHSRVAMSNIYLLKKMGAEVTVAGPPTLIPKYIQEAFDIRVEYNLQKALEWCDVANVLRIQLERQNQVLFSSLREYSLAYGINKRLLDSLNKKIVIMHPGPINRGVELDSDAADSNQSIILQQVENGVAVRMAVLYLLSGGREMS